MALPYKKILLVGAGSGESESVLEDIVTLIHTTYPSVDSGHQVSVVL